MCKRRTVEIWVEDDNVELQVNVILGDQSWYRPEMTDDEVRQAWVDAYNRNVAEGDPLRKRLMDETEQDDRKDGGCDGEGTAVGGGSGNCGRLSNPDGTRRTDGSGAGSSPGRGT